MRQIMILLLTLVLIPTAAADVKFPLKAKRVLFLGDSITHSGGYVAWIETQARLANVDPMPEIVNLGLSSETCSGLSEPKHPFPRPDVHERLDRALKRLSPDVVVACYGMNDGIYYPLSEERFRAFKQGATRLVDRCHAAGAKVVLLTPPPFDAEPLRQGKKLQGPNQQEYGYTGIYEHYDEVLTAYAKWIMQNEAGADMVVDVHTPLVEYTAELRKTNPSATLARDGIHPTAEGHQQLGNVVLRAWGITPQDTPDKEMLRLVTQRTKMLHDAWLSEVGHKRPRVKPGMPVEAAQKEAAGIENQIQALKK